MQPNPCNMIDCFDKAVYIARRKLDMKTIVLWQLCHDAFEWHGDC